MAHEGLLNLVLLISPAHEQESICKSSLNAASQLEARQSICDQEKSLSTGTNGLFVIPHQRTRPFEY